MPQLHILAGPNGTGKTTWFETSTEKGFIDVSLPFLNIDVIAKMELGGYNEENFAHAEQIYRARIREYLSQSKDFIIESNLARTADYDWISNMIKAGYEILLYFLCTKNVATNKNRVKCRVLEGGHDIPENIIENRYKLSLIYLKSKIYVFKKCYLIDNSTDTPIIQAIVSEGKLEMKIENCEDWVNNVLYIVDRKH